MGRKLSRVADRQIRMLCSRRSPAHYANVVHRSGFMTFISRRLGNDGISSEHSKGPIRNYVTAKFRGPEKRMRRLFILMPLAVMVASPASAITCHGNFQVVGGQEISTPYCRDNELGRVAREAGFKVSNEEVRNSGERKGEICRYLRDDNRVDVACEEALPDDSGAH
jgi:hypothetical protein